MLENGQKFRGKDGRIVEIIAPVMTEPVTYLVKFADTGEQKIIGFKQPPVIEKSKPGFFDAVIDTVTDIAEAVDQEFKNLRKNIRNRH